MNKNTRIAGMLAIFLCLHGVASAAESAAVAERIARVETGLRDPVAIKGEPARTMMLVDRMKAWHVPGVSIAVINDGAIEWSRAYGLAEAGSGRSLTTASLLQAASISKLITSAAALRLVVDGKLRLDEDVNMRLRSWKVPENAFTAGHPATRSRCPVCSATLPACPRQGCRVMRQGVRRRLCCRRWTACPRRQRRLCVSCIVRVNAMAIPARAMPWSSS